MNNLLLNLKSTDIKVDKSNKNIKPKEENKENNEFSTFILNAKLSKLENIKKNTKVSKDDGTASSLTQEKAQKNINKSEKGVTKLLNLEKSQKNANKPQKRMEELLNKNNKETTILKKHSSTDSTLLVADKSSKPTNKSETQKQVLDKPNALIESLNLINIKLIKNNTEINNKKTIKPSNLNLLKLKNNNNLSQHESSKELVSTTPKTTTKKNIPSPQRAPFLEKSEHSSLKESSKELMPTTSKTTTKANSPSSLQPIIKEKLNFMDNLNLLDNKTNSSPKVNQNANSFQEKVSSYKTMENVKTQIHDTIKYLSQDNKKQVILKLMPESLGKLDINISQIKQNTKVEIKVQNQETLQLLNDNQTSLKDLFSAIKKAGNDVSFSFDNNTNQQSSKESNSQNKEKQNKKYRTEKNILHYSDNETMTNYVGLIEIVV